MQRDTPNVKKRIDTELDDRDAAALTEYMTVLAEGGDVYSVTTESGREYVVDAREGRCTCPDHEYRDTRCKHLRRVAFATGERSVPAWADTDAVDPQLGLHVDGSPQVVATDGGVIERPESGHERTRVPCSGGVLVFESRELGKELVGFEQVTEWDGVRSALVARGHDVGAIHHLPELDE